MISRRGYFYIVLSIQYHWQRRIYDVGGPSHQWRSQGRGTGGPGPLQNVFEIN